MNPLNRFPRMVQEYYVDRLRQGAKDRRRRLLQVTSRGEAEAYVRSVRKLAEHYGQAPDQLSEKQVREYFLFLKNDRRFASATLKMAFYGIRFFYTHTVPREWAHGLPHG
jgi:hypothetical protein